MPTTIQLCLSKPHPAQRQVLAEAARFNVLCAGRRFGKSRLGIERCAGPMLAGQPVGWFAPTYKNLSDLWREAVEVFKPITKRKLETEHRLELITGGSLDMWSLDSTTADSIRGRRYARAIVDECAAVRGFMGIWDLIIRPTLVDFAGDAWFMSTPKGANDFQTLYDRGQSDEWPEWRSWRFPSSANPHLPPDEIEAMRRELPTRAFEQEVEARFIDEVTGALWTWSNIEGGRLSTAPELARIVVAIDPAVTANADSDETGIVAAGISAEDHFYVLADSSGRYSPLAWAQKAVAQYESLAADRIIGEVNNGGDLVEGNLRAVRANVPYRAVRASRGKATRAEPISALYEQGRVHHVGSFPDLELQMTTWSPTDDKESPDRVDALVWALTALSKQRQRRKAVAF